jgi:hypothetical protein
MTVDKRFMVSGHTSERSEDKTAAFLMISSMTEHLLKNDFDGNIRGRTKSVRKRFARSAAKDNKTFDSDKSRPT